MIGDRIKQARLALGYSAEQVAAHLGVSPATIYRYENGDIAKLPSKHIKPLAEYLCVSPSYLMDWTEQPFESDTKLSSTQQTVSTDEARILASGVDKLPKAQREQALAVVRAMFTQYSDYFTGGENTDDDT